MKIFILLFSLNLFFIYPSLEKVKPETKNGQEIKLKKVINILSSSLKEVYFCPKKNKVEKEGKYLLLFNGMTLVQGQYLQGQKHGVWEYYTKSGELELKFDFNSLTIIEGTTYSKFDNMFYIDSQWLYVSKEVIQNNENLVAPLFICGRSAYLYLHASIIKFPVSAHLSGKSGQVWVEVVIDDMGKATSFECIKSPDKSFNKEALISFKEVIKDKEWIPAKLNGKDVSCKAVFVLTFNNLGIINLQ